MSPTSQLACPLGVVIPSKNSRPYLADHVRGLLPWIHLASEVVVVDSFSTDGTVDYLRKNLPHPNIRFCEHPPGLYASWNYGISQIQSPYFFMATTGDLMSEQGIRALISAACELKCDVVLSKPHFRDNGNNPLADTPWPIDDAIETLGIKTPRLLTQIEAVLFTALHPEGAMLGSSASNVYRTEVWKKIPFPTDFGTIGDGAWGFLHAAEIRWGIVPQKYSSFLVHPNSATPAEKKSFAESKRPDRILREAMTRWLSEGVVGRDEFERLCFEELTYQLEQFLNAKTAFDQNRHSKIPWILNPFAWKNRLQRQASKRQLNSLKLKIVSSAGKVLNLEASRA